MSILIAAGWGVGIARAEDPPTEEPAEAAPPPAPAPAPSPTPTMADLAGLWWVASSVDGKEIVDWGCTNPPDSLEFDEGFVTLVIAGATNAGKITSSATRGTTLALATSLATCSGSKEVAVSWLDGAHKVLVVDRCAGTPRRVHAVRSASAGVPIQRQCCDSAGKLAKRVGANDPCPGGTQGQKPVPLKP